MHYAIINYLKLYLLSAQARTESSEESNNQKTVKLTNLLSELRAAYAKETNDFQRHLTSIANKMRLLNEAKADSKIDVDSYNKERTQLEAEYYGEAFSDFIGSLDKPPSFNADFQNFYRYIVEKAISRSLDQKELVEFIKEKAYNKMQIEENYSLVAFYVKRVNNHFPLMTKQEHTNFFSLISHEPKLKDIDLHAFNGALHLIAFGYWKDKNWVHHLLNSADLTPNNFALILLTNMESEKIYSKEVFSFLVGILPQIENANQTYQFSNGAAANKWYQPFSEELLKLSVDSVLLRRLISIKKDLVACLNPNSLVDWKGKLVPNFLLIFKMMKDDKDFVYRVDYDFFKKIDLSASFFSKIKNKNEIKEEVINLLEGIIEWKVPAIWPYFSVSTLEFIKKNFYKKNFPEAEFHLLMEQIRTSYLDVIALSDSKDIPALNKAIDENLHYIDCIFKKSKSNSFVRSEFEQPSGLLAGVFHVYMSSFLGLIAPLHRISEIIEFMITRVEASAIKYLVWKNVMEKSPDFAYKIKETIPRKLKLLYSSPSFKKVHVDLLASKGKNKKRKYLAQSHLEEIKQLANDKEKNKQTKPLSEEIEVLSSAVADITLAEEKEAITPLPLVEKEEQLVLSLDDQITFECGIRAAIAGSPDITIKWIAQLNKQPGYFTVDFSQISDTIRVNGQLNQDYWFATFTAAEKESFFKVYVFRTLKKYLSQDVSVSLEDGLLRVTPKIQHCSYPVDMHRASFQYIKNYLTLSVVKKSSLVVVSDSKVSHKRPDPYRSSLPAASDLGLKQTTQDTASLMTPPPVIDPLTFIKTLLHEMVADEFPNQAFHFLMLKEEKGQCIIEFNLKGAPYLADNKQGQVDTYVIMKSIVYALQAALGEKAATISPDSLDPMAYHNKMCKLIINIRKQNFDRLVNLSYAELRNQFNDCLPGFKKTQELYEAIYACEKEMQGCDHQEIITLNAVIEKDEKAVCKSYQRLMLQKEQFQCMKALFDEIGAINKMEENEIPVCVREGIRASRFVCYHRLFDNLSIIFDRNKDKTNALFANTLRDIFRHGYMELSTDFTCLLEAFIAALMDYKESSSPSILFAPEKECYLSFAVTQAMQGKLVQEIKAFTQAKSNHAIGEGSKNERRAAAPRLKVAIKEMHALADIEESKKQTFIVAMASLIGEVDKDAPYGEIYGEMGTHNNNISEMPADLTQRVYGKYCVLQASNMTLKKYA